MDFLKSINDYFILNDFYLIIKVGTSKLFIYQIDNNGLINEIYCNNFHREFNIIRTSILN